MQNVKFRTLDLKQLKEVYSKDYAKKLLSFITKYFYIILNGEKKRNPNFIFDEDNVDFYSPVGEAYFAISILQDVFTYNYETWNNTEGVRNLIFQTLIKTEVEYARLGSILSNRSLEDIKAEYSITK